MNDIEGQYICRVVRSVSLEVCTQLWQYRGACASQFRQQNHSLNFFPAQLHRETDLSPVKPNIANYRNIVLQRVLTRTNTFALEC